MLLPFMYSFNHSFISLTSFEILFCKDTVLGAEHIPRLVSGAIS